MGDAMESINWTDLAIWAAIAAVGLMVLGFAWRLLRRFIKIWLFVVVIIAIGAFAYNAGWLGTV